MPKQSEVCCQINFSPCIPDNPEPPLCELGHGWSMDCMKENKCPDYKPSTVLTLEELKRGIEKAK